jgi:phthalate 4,5-dioxygenase oxygenase subunit
MLSREDNEALTRIGPGTLMGDLMRAYWMPALLSAELPDRDGTPVRVRLMGEKLVAFRDSEGRIGLLEESCPHRGASLALAVNEECGLRCLYHGWKFDVDGTCVDQPAEAKSGIGNAHARAYRTREAGGMIWAYLGDTRAEPPFPDFEWLALPPAHCGAFKVLGECNYAQLLEGSIDTVHAGVLHRAKPWSVPVQGAAWQTQLKAKLEVEYTAYGMRYAGIRQLEDGRFNARVTPVVLPFFTLIPTEIGPSNTRRLVNAFVPRDDESTWVLQFLFDEVRPVDTQFRIVEGGLQTDANFRKLSNADNGYNQDRAAMKHGNMSGIRGIMVQDHAVGETQGRILDRSKEHLGTSDLAVVAWRRQMLKVARGYRDQGLRPPGTEPGVPFGMIRAEVANYDASETWKTRAPLPADLALRAAG